MIISRIIFIAILIFDIYETNAFAPEPTAIIRSQVTTFSYGGFGQIERISKRSILSGRFRRTAAQDSSDLYKNDSDPFAMPEVESYPIEDQKPHSNMNYINQQDPRVQEVDVVGWFE